jgi:hypothetical protein
MPISTQQGHIIMRCEVCNERALFGYGADFTAALLQFQKGNKERAKQLMGEWYCSEHKR